MTNGGRTSFLNSDYLKARDFCGEDSKHIQHTSRFYSQRWRTWAACLIQVSWCRHCRKKIEKPLQEAEDRMHRGHHLCVKNCCQYTLVSCASIIHIIITPIT